MRNLQVSEPLLSIIIPTRNRARFLARALASARAQNAADLEIIVSDNASSDDTDAVAQSAAREDGRVRYVRRSTPGDMIASWTFALSHARGTWWTFLSDDDALVPGALETALEAAERHQAPLAVWRYGFYYYPSWHELSRRNHLLLQPFTGAISAPPVADTLAHAFDRLEMVNWPQFSNALMHRDVWKRMLSLVGQPFPCPAGDCFTGMVLLLAAERCAVVDQPLTLYGWWGGSYTSSLAKQGPAALTAQPLPHVPLPFHFTTNLLTSALLLAQQEVAPLAASFQVNWARYFAKTREEMAFLRSKGVVVDELEKLWHEQLAAQPAHVRRKLISDAHEPQQQRQDGAHAPAARTARPWRQKLRDRINRSPFLFHWETQLRPRLRLERALLIDGRRAGFADILGATRRMPMLIARGFARAHRRGRACTGVVV